MKKKRFLHVQAHEVMQREGERVPNKNYASGICRNHQNANFLVRNSGNKERGGQSLHTFLSEIFSQGTQKNLQDFVLVIKSTRLAPRTMERTNSQYRRLGVKRREGGFIIGQASGKGQN